MSELIIIDKESKVSIKAKIDPFVVINNSIIEDEVVITSFSYISNSYISKGSVIKSSYIDNSKVGNNCIIGPYAHLRENALICDNVKIGNFVEVKKSEIGKKVKASHHAYLGDSKIGENVNIGCGVITCNYDGVKKHKTEIGDNSFIGSNSNLIAPLKIGNNVYIAAGSTINQDITDNKFAISRVKQNTKERR